MGAGHPGAAMIGSFAILLTLVLVFAASKLARRNMADLFRQMCQGRVIALSVARLQTGVMGRNARRSACRAGRGRSTVNPMHRS